MGREGKGRGREGKGGLREGMGGKGWKGKERGPPPYFVQFL